jgi:hypothetical protein
MKGPPIVETEEELANKHAPGEISWRACLCCGGFFRSLSRYNRRCKECRLKDASVGPMFNAARHRKAGHKESKDDAA